MAFFALIFSTIAHFSRNLQILRKNAKNFDKRGKMGKIGIWNTQKIVVNLHRNLGGIVNTELFRLFFIDFSGEKSQDLVKISQRFVEKSQDFFSQDLDFLKFHLATDNQILKKHKSRTDKKCEVF